MRNIREGRRISTEQKLIVKYKQEYMSFVEALDREYKTLLDKLNDEISQFTCVAGESVESIAASYGIVLEEVSPA